MKRKWDIWFEDISVLKGWFIFYRFGFLGKYMHVPKRASDCVFRLRHTWSSNIVSEFYLQGHRNGLLSHFWPFLWLDAIASRKENRYENRKCLLLKRPMHARNLPFGDHRNECTLRSDYLSLQNDITRRSSKTQVKSQMNLARRAWQLAGYVEKASDVDIANIRKIQRYWANNIMTCYDIINCLSDQLPSDIFFRTSITVLD